MMLYTEIEERQEIFLHDLFRFIRIPSISMTGEGIQEAVTFLHHELEEAGCSVQVYQTAGNPVVYAEVGPQNASFSLLIYGHYDVFPVDDRTNWNSEPFLPRCEGDRIIGRGAGDNKGQILAHIEAIKLFRQTYGALPVKVKLLIEGEEETGSKNLPLFVSAHRDLLQADLCFYSDGPMFPDDQPVLLFGVRGALCLEFTAYGARRVLHSGNFGGIAPNPVLDLCRLFSAMVTPDGQFLVPGVEKGVPQLTDAERKVLDTLPLDRENLLREMGVAPTTERYHQNFYEQLFCRPTFNVAGFVGGFTGDGIKTVIPDKATAKVDMRLVGDQDPDDIMECMRRFIHDQGFEHIEMRKLVSQPASKTPIDHPYATIVRSAVEQGFQKAPLLVPSLGGTTPDYVFTKILHIPSIVVPYAPYDENNHAPNESTKVSCYLKGIYTTVTLFKLLGQQATS